MPSFLIPTRRIVASAIALIALAAAGTISALPATAAAPTGPPGWVRLAHLSPDTAAVDVRVDYPNGGVAFRLKGVGYGGVSPYQQLPEGIYSVRMTPSGAQSGTDPIVTTPMKVIAGKAQTIAAFGANKKLTIAAFTDDLTPPQTGTARVRLIQASIRVKTVDVDTTTGMIVASKAKAGSATPYSAVPAGAWTLALRGQISSGKAVSASSSVNLAGGSVSSLLVLDKKTGLELRPVLDSAAVAAAPIGGVNTGGGWLAEHPQLLHAAP